MYICIPVIVLFYFISIKDYWKLNLFLNKKRIRFFNFKYTIFNSFKSDLFVLIERECLINLLI
jgi:hypothetical protein